MVDKGLIVTIVLDSCYSGGATRGLLGSGVRGISNIDTSPRPTDSLVAGRDEVLATWIALIGSSMRSVIRLEDHEVVFVPPQP
jgi:hypothetical protein